MTIDKAKERIDWLVQYPVAHLKIDTKDILLRFLMTFNVYESILKSPRDITGVNLGHEKEYIEIFDYFRS
ncbi:hypothetical protein FACS1894167_06830 [Synergistales bacterium]|nr:hypothetical protein FACS1894167_06830 [Synergistales bacterium]